MICIKGDAKNKNMYPILKDEISLIADSAITLKNAVAQDAVGDIQFSEMINYVLNQLNAEGINCDVGIKKTLSLFFRKAYKNKRYSEDSDDKKKYANDIATNLEIQLMIENAECVKEENVLKIYEDLLGNFPDEGTNDNEFNVVAVIGEDTNEVEKENKFAQMIAWEKTKIKSESFDVKNAKPFVLSEIDLENGYATVFDALKIGCKYPCKQGEDSCESIDVEFINILNEKIGENEKVLFATYCKMCYDNTDSMSKGANGAYKPSFLKNIIQLLAITDKKIYLCKSLYEVTIIGICQASCHNSYFIVCNL